MRSLKTSLEENKTVFSRNIFYFSVCLTFNKLYWIEDQLGYFLIWILYVGKLMLASWTVGNLTVIQQKSIKFPWTIKIITLDKTMIISEDYHNNVRPQYN